MIDIYQARGTMKGRLRNPRVAGALEWRAFLGAYGLKRLPIAFDPA